MSIQNFTDQFGNYITSSPELTTKLAITITVFVILWLIRLIVLRILRKNLSSSRQQYRWRKNLSYTTGLLGILALGVIWFEGLQSLGTFLGLLSAGLAIALRDPVTDLAGWIFISLRSPFDVGDRVEIGTVKGDIIDIRIFKFTVLEIGNWVNADQSTGRVIHVPNHKIFTESIANYTSDFEFIWNEVQVLLTFESDWKKAKKVLQEIADHHMEDFIDHAERQVRMANKSYLVHYEYLTPIVYTDVKESGINLTIRHLSNPRKRRNISQAIWEDILEAVKDDGSLEFAYPTMRIMADTHTNDNTIESGNKSDAHDPELNDGLNSEE